jgi:hypothetical protein
MGSAKSLIYHNLTLPSKFATEPPMLGFQSFKTANRTLKGIEAMAMMVKEQTIYLKESFQDQIQFFNRLFNVYA